MARRKPVPEVSAENTAADEVSDYVQYFEEAEESTQDERRDAERDRDYYDNIQWTAEEEAKIKKRGQAPIVINRIKRKIETLRGLEKEQRSDPKAFPRNPQDEQAAHAATDAIRFVADNNAYDVTRSEVWENLLIEGLGGVEVIVEEKPRPKVQLMDSTAMTGPDYKIVISRIPWDRFFRDPHARKADFSDARYMGVVIWMDKQEAIEKWPDATDILESTITGAGGRSTSDTFDDRPQWQVWADPKRQRVRVVQIWVRRGAGWHYCVFTRGGKLEGGESPYQDEDGGQVCAMIMQSAFITRQNRRYGVVREMIGPQDGVNKSHSKFLHGISTRQTFGTRAAVKDVDAAKKEIAKPDGHLEIEHGEFGKDFGILPTGDMSSAQFQIMQDMKAELDLIGPNASMQGKSGGDPSGRAVIAQQQGGQLEIAPMRDALRQFDIRVYSAIWDRVRQFWTAERWIRVTDDERNIRFVGLNKPVTAGEEYLRQMEAKGAPPEALQQAQQQIANDPRAQQVIGIENNTAEMVVDIIMDDAPDSVTIQQEQFEQLVELVKTGFPIPPDVVIEASQLRNKDKLLEKMKPQQQQGPSPEERQLQIEQQKAEAGIALKQQEAELNAQAKVREAEINAASQQQSAEIDAESERQKALIRQQEHEQKMAQDRAEFEQKMLFAEREFQMKVAQQAQMAGIAARNAANQPEPRPQA